MSTHLRDDDLTNLGNYGTKFDDFDKVIAYDNDVEGGTAGNFGIKKCTDDMAEKSGENDFIFNFSESDIPLSANATYYVYLWTYWSQFGPKYYYPDHLICAIQVKDGAVKYAVATGGNTYNESSFSDIESSAKYTVTVNSADHMTKTSESGENIQSNLTKAMEPVVFKAADGYYFPEDYAVATVNGIMVRLDDSTQITVYGTPSANAEINLKAPTSTTQEVKPNATFKATGADTGTLSELVDGGSYAVSGASSDNFTLSGTTSKNLNGISAGTLSIVKKGNGTTTMDSVAQTIEVTKAETPSLKVTQPTTVGGKGSISATTAHEYSTDNANWEVCGENQELEAGKYYVRVAAKDTVLASNAQEITINAYSAPSKPGGSYAPTTQKPTVIADEGAEGTLSFYGDKLTIKVAEGYKITDVLVNGVSKGKVTELTGLKTGDKVEVKTEKKQEETKEPTNEEIIAALGSSKLVARSKLITLKNGKKAVRVTWYDKNGNEADFDGVEIYRSTQRYKEYGLKPFYASKNGRTEGYYVNTRDLKEGTTYYYKIRGYVLIDGQKYYTDYSLKAIRTII